MKEIASFYLGGAITSPALRDAFAILRPYQDIVVCLWPDDPLVSALPAGPYYEGVANESHVPVPVPQ